MRELKLLSSQSRFVGDNGERGRFDEHLPLMVCTTSKEKPSERDVSFRVYRPKK